MNWLPIGLPQFDSRKFLLAATASAGAGLVFLFLGASGVEAFGAFALLLSLAFAAVLAEPALRASRLAQEQEADLAFCLKQVAVCIDSGISFEASLKAASGTGAFGRELRKVLLEKSDLARALAAAAIRSPSPLCRRALLHLAVACATGKSGGLKRLAGEATALQLSRSREFSSKQAFYGVFFVTASAIVPAGFAAVATVGSAFLSFELSPRVALGAFILVFPAVNAALLALLYLQSPRSMME